MRYHFVIVESIANADIKKQPCQPSPCGPFSKCRSIGEIPSCSCLESYVGIPPNCRPECVTSSECTKNLACINQKCVDPCPGRCGLNAECRVVSHVVQCICILDFVGDPYLECHPTKENEKLEALTPCHPSPCGTNAECRERNGAGSCKCLSNYYGNPYEGCRPECVMNSDCPPNKACQQQKCFDPCPSTCGKNSYCQVINHVPTCNCPAEYTGDPYRLCSKIAERKLYLLPPVFSSYLYCIAI